MTMTETDQIARTSSPVTIAGLREDFRALGLRAGDIVLVHSALSGLGWVNGGPVAVVQALTEAVGSSGTIAMPAHSTQITDPANWRSPPVPSDWVDVIRRTMPPYDPRTTPTRDMGKIVEVFRTWPGTLRSSHPASSFAALGPLAAEITGHHPLDDPLGPASPLGALYRLGAKVLLIGVGFNRCTALHLAERMRWPDRSRLREGAPLAVDGERRWVRFDVPELMDDEAFVSVGESALAAGFVTVGKLGAGKGIVIDMRRLVDHAVAFWAARPDA